MFLALNWCGKVKLWPRCTERRAEVSIVSLTVSVASVSTSLDPVCQAPFPDNLLIVHIVQYINCLIAITEYWNNARRVSGTVERTAVIPDSCQTALSV